ncbi:MAG: BadF/BadG/BcrA/BcrD ATPase family protein [Bacteroidota bacterium]
MEYYMGIEGMASNFSICILSDNKGNIISAIKGEPLSLHTIPRSTLYVRIKHLIRSVISEGGLTKSIIPDTNLCIGLAGTTFKYDREVDLKKNVLEHITPKFKNVICTGDAEIAFLSCALKPKGSIITSTLGSTVLIANEVEQQFVFTRYGGWGPVFGDEGSSYCMGCETLRALAKTYDNREELPKLWFEVNEWLMNPKPKTYSWSIASNVWNQLQAELSINASQSIDPRTLLFYFAHHFNHHNAGVNQPSEGLELWRNITGGLVIPLMKAYEHDRLAKNIILKGVQSLVDQHYGAYRTNLKIHSIKNYEPIVLFGGVFNHFPNFSELVKNKLERKYGKELSFITTNNGRIMRPVCGALLLALSHSQTGSLKFPTESIIENVFKSQGDVLFSEILQKF